MEGKHITICVVAGVLGLIATILGFVAEATRITANQVVFADEICYYPSSSSPSLALGVVAAIILLIQQVVISVGSGCFCCRGTPCPSTCGGITALICYIFSWLVCLGAFAVLIYGAALNNINTLANTVKTLDDGCPIPKFGIFIVAGVLCIISITLGFIAYIVLISNDNKSGAPNVANEQGIARAKPQMPTNV